MVVHTYSLCTWEAEAGESDQGILSPCSGLPSNFQCFLSVCLYWVFDTPHLHLDVYSTIQNEYIPNWNPSQQRVGDTVKFSTNAS